MEYQIISDGSCDLDLETAEKNNIKIVPFYVAQDGENYGIEGKDVKIRDFYEYMNSIKAPEVYPKTSTPSTEDYMNAFMPYVKDNIAIICICINTKFSASYNSAINAAEQIKEEYSDAQIAVIDSTVNTVLQGMLVLEAARMQRSGMDYQTTIDTIENIKGTGRIIFTIGSIDYLLKGGRMGKLLTIVRGNLRIRPLIILKDGHITPGGVALSRINSIKQVLSKTKSYLDSLGESLSNFNFSIGYGYDYEEAVSFKEQFSCALGIAEENIFIPLRQIGATIGVHTGPYPLGVGILKKFDA